MRLAGLAGLAARLLLRLGVAGLLALLILGLGLAGACALAALGLVCGSLAAALVGCLDALLIRGDDLPGTPSTAFGRLWGFRSSGNGFGLVFCQLVLHVGTAQGRSQPIAAGT